MWSALSGFYKVLLTVNLRLTGMGPMERWRSWMIYGDLSLMSRGPSLRILHHQMVPKNMSNTVLPRPNPIGTGPFKFVRGG